mgnify:CR=1 FL=1
MSDMQLIKFDTARRALAEAHSIDEVKDIRDKMEALRLYLKQQGEGLEMQNQCAEIKLRAERKAGELLGEMKANGEVQKQGDYQKSHDENFDKPKISDLVDRNESFRFQLIASLPEPDFEAEIETAITNGRELTSSRMLKKARQYKAANKDEIITPPPAGKYRCIVIDPPWPVQKIVREVRPNQDLDLDYQTMTLEEIAALPVGELVMPDGCHLYLWITQKFLPVGLELAKKWGFSYQCLMTWRKNTGMTPYSWMYDTEHVIFATCGGLPLQKFGLRLSFDAPVVRHSEKPDVFYADRVCLASPEPRLEMFARKKREGFTVWGNEVIDGQA